MNNVIIYQCNLFTDAIPDDPISDNGITEGLLISRQFVMSDNDNSFFQAVNHVYEFLEQNNWQIRDEKEKTTYKVKKIYELKICGEAIYDPAPKTITKEQMEEWLKL